MTTETPYCNLPVRISHTNIIHDIAKNLVNTLLYTQDIESAFSDALVDESLATIEYAYDLYLDANNMSLKDFLVKYSDTSKCILHHVIHHLCDKLNAGESLLESINTSMKLLDDYPVSYMNHFTNLVLIYNSGPTIKTANPYIIESAFYSSTCIAYHGDQKSSMIVSGAICRNEIVNLFTDNVYSFYYENDYALI